MAWEIKRSMCLFETICPLRVGPCLLRFLFFFISVPLRLVLCRKLVQAGIEHKVVTELPTIIPLKEVGFKLKWNEHDCHRYCLTYCGIEAISFDDLLFGNQFCWCHGDSATVIVSASPIRNWLSRLQGARTIQVLTVTETLVLTMDIFNFSSW